MKKKISDGFNYCNLNSRKQPLRFIRVITKKMIGCQEIRVLRLIMMLNLFPLVNFTTIKTGERAFRTARHSSKS